MITTTSTGAHSVVSSNWPATANPEVAGLCYSYPFGARTLRRIRSPNAIASSLVANRQFDQEGRIEASPSGWASRDFGIEGHPPGAVPYHAHIMKQEGLIEGVDATMSESRGRELVPTSLTWKGLEFLDLARDQDRWNRARAIIAKLGGAPISVWTKVLTELLLQVASFSIKAAHVP